MRNYNYKAPQIFPLHVNDTATPIGFALVRKVGGIEQPINLTGCTVVFRMVRDDGVVKIAAGAAVVDGIATDGNVFYEWTALDVDEEGTYYAYFIVTNGATNRIATYPPEEGKIRVLIYNDAKTDL